MINPNMIPFGHTENISMPKFSLPLLMLFWSFTFFLDAPTPPPYIVCSTTVVLNVFIIPTYQAYINLEQIGREKIQKSIYTSLNPASRTFS